MKQMKIEFAILAVGICILGFMIRAGINDFRDRDRTIEVKGLAERTVNSDWVSWQIGYEENANDVKTLFAQIDSTNSKIKNYLLKNNVSANEISIDQPNVTDHSNETYEKEEQRPKFRYTATNTISVRSNKVKQIYELQQKQVDLLSLGFTPSLYNSHIDFSFNNLNSIKPNMIAEATANARIAGNSFAEDSHSSLGKIKTATQGQFEINSIENDPLKKNVRVVTNIEYYLSN